MIRRLLHRLGYRTRAEIAAQFVRAPDYSFVPSHITVVDCDAKVTLRNGSIKVLSFKGCDGDISRHRGDYEAYSAFQTSGSFVVCRQVAIPVADIAAVEFSITKHRATTPLFQWLEKEGRA